MRTYKRFIVYPVCVDEPDGYYAVVDTESINGGWQTVRRCNTESLAKTLAKVHEERHAN